MSRLINTIYMTALHILMQRNILSAFDVFDLI